LKDCVQAKELQLGDNDMDAALVENMESLVKDRAA
jgi:glutamate 5-kinase